MLCYLQALLQAHGRRIDVVNLAEHEHENLLADLVAIVSACMARLSGQRRAKCTTERMVAELRAEELRGEAEEVVRDTAC
jgi:predicted site-specific integrase-resolvase